MPVAVVHQNAETVSNTAAAVCWPFGLFFRRSQYPGIRSRTLLSSGLHEGGPDLQSARAKPRNGGGVHRVAGKSESCYRRHDAVVPAGLLACPSLVPDAFDPHG